MFVFTRLMYSARGFYCSSSFGKGFTFIASPDATLCKVEQSSRLFLKNVEQRFKRLPDRLRSRQSFANKNFSR